jgi:hypothetical protein
MIKMKENSIFILPKKIYTHEKPAIFWEKQYYIGPGIILYLDKNLFIIPLKYPSQ